MTRRARMPLLALTMLLLTLNPGRAAVLLDQNNITINGNANAMLHWQQEVTAGVDGLLAGITLFAQRDTNLRLRIAEAAGPYDGPFAFSQTVSLARDVGTYIDVSSAGIMLTTGEVFLFDLTEGQCCYLFLSATTYAGGDMFRLINDVWLNQTESGRQTFAFQTFVDVPEPSSIAGLGIALVGLGAQRASRRGRARRPAAD